MPPEWVVLCHVSPRRLIWYIFHKEQQWSEGSPSDVCSLLNTVLLSNYPYRSLFPVSKVELRKQFGLTNNSSEKERDNYLCERKLNWSFFSCCFSRGLWAQLPHCKVRCRTLCRTLKGGFLIVFAITADC